MRKKEKWWRKMLVAYASKTGNVDRFIKKLGHKNVKRIINGDEQVSEPFIFLTYTTGIGEIPEEVQQFCQINQKLMCAVASSGNRNWGANYAIAADKLSTQFGVPVIHKFELAGRPGDVETFRERIDEYEISRT